MSIHHILLMTCFSISPFRSHIFAAYAELLFQKCIIRPHNLHKASKVHLVFDHPTGKGYITILLNLYGYFQDFVDRVAAIEEGTEPIC